MPKATKKARTGIGLPPGTLVYTGEREADRVKITEIVYNESEIQEKEVKEVEECFARKDRPSVTWINIDGIHRLDIIEKVGKHFNLHPLVLEDIVNREQRPKMEDLGDYVFIVLKMFQFDETEKRAKMEQISLVLTPNCVISFQESEGDVFDPIRTRLRENKGRIKKMGADYLVYSLIDAVVDNYFAILERLGETVEEIEDEVVTSPTPEVLHSIHSLKREMILLRKSVWPLREVIDRLERWESPLIGKGIEIYFRDVYDHTIQVIDAIETLRDMLSGMLDIYLSSISNRMNEVMKVLTIIATIFIPLTLVAGIYGMNFRFMPELEQPWGYPMAYLIMFAISLVMIVYFRRKKWI